MFTNTKLCFHLATLSNSDFWLHFKSNFKSSTDENEMKMTKAQGTNNTYLENALRMAFVRLGVFVNEIALPTRFVVFFAFLLRLK